MTLAGGLLVNREINQGDIFPQQINESSLSEDMAEDECEKYQMEKKLQESEQKFRRIFEGSIDGLVLWDNELRIVDINYAAEQIFRQPKEKLIGRLLYEVFRTNMK